MSDERPPESVATEIRDAVDALNSLLRDAATRGFSVELEAQRVDVIESKQKATRVHLGGVFLRVEPTPRPVTPPPTKRRGHA